MHLSIILCSTLLNMPQVLTEDSESAKHALYWYVEDLVKRAYARFIAALEVCSCDPLEFLRERSMRLSMNLLAEKPEQEVANFLLYRSQDMEETDKNCQ